jgi:coenzyme F420-0:L-glutamate ligase / coenzyme F420-1:gamma-L-glutamate ligase
LGEQTLQTEMSEILSPDALHEFLRTRKSVRHFRSDPIPLEILERILETACQAPSAHNRQPWRFVVLASQRSRECLVESLSSRYRQDLSRDGMDASEIERIVERSKVRILGAPLAILLCQDAAIGDEYPDADRQEAELTMGVQGAALAGGALLLAAHAEGIGGVWMCAPLFAQTVAREVFRLPESWAAQALILLGYPDGPPKQRSRLPLSEVVQFV